MKIGLSNDLKATISKKTESRPFENLRKLYPPWTLEQSDWVYFGEILANYPKIHSTFDARTLTEMSEYSVSTLGESVLERIEGEDEAAVSYSNIEKVLTVLNVFSADRLQKTQKSFDEISRILHYNHSLLLDADIETVNNGREGNKLKNLGHYHFNRLLQINRGKLLAEHDFELEKILDILSYKKIDTRFHQVYLPSNVFRELENLNMLELLEEFPVEEVIKEAQLRYSNRTTEYVVNKLSELCNGKPKPIKIKECEAKPKIMRKAVINPGNALPYDWNQDFNVKDTINHPTYGMGSVTGKIPGTRHDKIVVAFKDHGCKTLVCNKQDDT